LPAGDLARVREIGPPRAVRVWAKPDAYYDESTGAYDFSGVYRYYQWYRIAYSVVNEVNAELDPAVPLLVGGPVTYQFNGGYLRAFLDRFAADSDPAKRLDFVSYHEYGRRANPSDVESAKSTIRTLLTNRRLDPATPVVVSEYGVFPGPPEEPAGHGTTYAEDLLTQAAAMATLGTYYVRGGMDSEDATRPRGSASTHWPQRTVPASPCWPRTTSGQPAVPGTT